MLSCIGQTPLLLQRINHNFLGRCYGSKQDKAAEQAKNQTKQSSKDTPIAVQATENKHEWNCAVTHDNPNNINKIPMTILHGDKNSIGIGYSLNRRCCTVVKTKSFQVNICH